MNERLMEHYCLTCGDHEMANPNILTICRSCDNDILRPYFRERNMIYECRRYIAGNGNSYMGAVLIIADSIIEAEIAFKNYEGSEPKEIVKLEMKNGILYDDGSRELWLERKGVTRKA